MKAACKDIKYKAIANGRIKISRVLLRFENSKGMILNTPFIISQELRFYANNFFFI